MDRRRFIATVASGLLAVPLAAEAQQAAKVPRIGSASGTADVLWAEHCRTAIGGPQATL